MRPTDHKKVTLDEVKAFMELWSRHHPHYMAQPMTGKRAIQFLVWRLFLRPLIEVDLKLRQWGLREDRVFWADRIAMNWGYFGR